MTEQVKVGQIWQHKEIADRQRLVHSVYQEDPDWVTVYDPADPQGGPFNLTKEYLTQVYYLAEDLPETVETYSVAEIREAFAKHATEDDWGIKSFYESGLLNALRGAYDEYLKEGN